MSVMRFALRNEVGRADIQQCDKRALRLARKSDVPEIVELMALVQENIDQSEREWWGPESKASVEECLNNGVLLVYGDRFHVTAKIRGSYHEQDMERIVGMCMAKPAPEWYKNELGLPDKCVWVVNNVCVRPSHRGNGIQRMLMQKINSMLFTRGVMLGNTGMECEYIVCAAHMDNHYSIRNIMESGYSSLVRSNSDTNSKFHEFIISRGEHDCWEGCGNIASC